MKIFIVKKIRGHFSKDFTNRNMIMKNFDHFFQECFNLSKNKFSNWLYITLDIYNIVLGARLAKEHVIHNNTHTNMYYWTVIHVLLNCNTILLKNMYYWLYWFCSELNNFHRLSLRLQPLDRIGGHNRRIPLKALSTILMWCTGGFRGALY